MKKITYLTTFICLIPTFALADIITYHAVNQPQISCKGSWCPGPGTLVEAPTNPTEPVLYDTKTHVLTLSDPDGSKLNLNSSNGFHDYRTRSFVEDKDHGVETNEVNVSFPDLSKFIVNIHGTTTANGKLVEDLTVSYAFVRDSFSPW